MNETMSVPVIVLERDHHLDELSLDCNIRSGRKCLVSLTRNKNLDNLAEEHYESFTCCAGVPPRKLSNPGSERMSWCRASNRLGSGKATSTRKRKRLTLASHHKGCKHLTTFNSWRGAFPNISYQGGCESTTSLDPRTEISFINTSNKEGTGEGAVLDKRSKQTPTKFSGQCASEKSAKIDNTILLTSAVPSDDDGSKPGLSGRPTFNCHSQDEINANDFMCLLCLSPTHVIQRARKCTHHRISKYLHLKSHNLWSKICGERNYCYNRIYSDMLRPCHVLLQRSSSIDHLALQPHVQSIDLKGLWLNSKCAKNDTLEKSQHTVSVKLNRDPFLDQLAVRNYNGGYTSCSFRLSSFCPGTNVSSPFVAKLTTTVPSSAHTSVRQAALKCIWRAATVKISRSSSLDTLALQNSNLMIESPSPNPSQINIVSPHEDKVTSTGSMALSSDKEPPGVKKLVILIKRDSSIDQLTVENVKTSISESCTGFKNPTVHNHQKLHHQPISKLPLDSERSCSHELGLLDVIKLKRVSWNDWSFQPSPSTSSESVSESSTSKRAACEGTRNSRIHNIAPSTNDRPVGLYPDVVFHDILPSAIQPTVSQLSTKHTVFRPRPVKYSTKRKNTSLVSCTTLSRRRATSIPSEEETFSAVDHVIPPVKTTNLMPPKEMFNLNGNHFSTSRDVEPLILKGNRKRISENCAFDHTKFRAVGQKHHPKSYNFLKPSVSRYVKKTLTLRSPNAQSA